MLAVSPLRSNLDKDGDNNGEGDATTMEASFPVGGGEFSDFSGANNLLDSIDFDDLFMGMHDRDDLPDLEMDPELLAELRGEDLPSEARNSPGGSMSFGVKEKGGAEEGNHKDTSQLVKPSHPSSCNIIEKPPWMEENGIVNNKDKESKSITSTTVNSSIKKMDIGKKKSSPLNNKRGDDNDDNNNNQGKRKAKVDWTPELHRRFVQAVEQLGVEKAVPSRILELMGIDSLTRHNVASHLQKYRSHRRHLQARNSTATDCTQKGGGNISPWHSPTIMGFPPISPMHLHPFRPLHVWGHPTAPTMDLQRGMPMWPGQIVPPASQPPAWASPPPSDPSFWHLAHRHVQNVMTPTGACFPQPLQSTRFTRASVPSIPPHAMYKAENGNISPLPAAQSSDSYVLKESIDTAVGDVLEKPWLPLPIGLKPPSIDSVLAELQRQGIAKIPPSAP